MTINIVCSLLNIALDVLLIVVLKQGLWSAAVASCISMSLGAVWSLVPFVCKRLPLVFSWGRIGGRQMLTILANGSSEFFISIAGSLFAVIINVVLLRLGGATAVAAAAIVEYVQSLTGMVIHSMVDGMQPAVSYCFGAGLLQRMKRIQRAVMAASAALSLASMLFLLFLAVLVPLWGLDGVWLLQFVAGIFSAIAAIIIVRRVRLQQPPSAPPVTSFFQPTQSFNYRRKNKIR